ncbi:TMEM165/GDT1 family protein [Tepidiforma flava]|uniref:GDT1 family protein n=1 Tax=Tepidiforma flava TaxID=3004094 RepID=A0ABY7M9X5_9CHLR|nr:TMEM165/GDT1 family protein [Tepidiforma flava]WBL37215.1 TMEM165/GDT1 family protein [Tepidiforma flava]
MSAFFVSTALIFFAELGDKSQLVALWFATRYRWWIVLAGVSLATLVVHLGSVALGLAFDELLPERWLLTIVGVSFFAFAAWSLRGDTLEEEPGEPRLGKRFGAFGVVTAAFFLSELGDKTMLATVSLAGREASAVGVWLGSTLGMVLADAVAIGAGVLAGKRLPQRAIAVVAALLFAVFGAWALWSAWV